MNTQHTAQNKQNINQQKGGGMGMITKMIVVIVHMALLYTCYLVFQILLRSEVSTSGILFTIFSKASWTNLKTFFIPCIALLVSCIFRSFSGDGCGISLSGLIHGALRLFMTLEAFAVLIPAAVIYIPKLKEFVMSKIAITNTDKFIAVMIGIGYTIGMIFSSIFRYIFNTCY